MYFTMADMSTLRQYFLVQQKPFQTYSHCGFACSWLLCLSYRVNSSLSTTNKFTRRRSTTNKIRRMQTKESRVWVTTIFVLVASWSSFESWSFASCLNLAILASVLCFISLAVLSLICWSVSLCEGVQNWWTSNTGKEREGKEKVFEKQKYVMEQISNDATYTNKHIFLLHWVLFVNDNFSKRSKNI